MAISCTWRGSRPRWVCPYFSTNTLTTGYFSVSSREPGRWLSTGAMPRPPFLASIIVEMKWDWIVTKVLGVTWVLTPSYGSDGKADIKRYICPFRFTARINGFNLVCANNACTWVRIHYRRSAYLQHLIRINYPDCRMFRRLEPNLLPTTDSLDLAANANSDN